MSSFPPARAPSNLLETSFVLRMLAAMLLVLQGGLRLRGDREQLHIWTSGMQYPWALMRTYGACQVGAALLTIFAPWVGLAAAAAIATTELLNHAVRMQSIGAAVFDIAILGIAALLSLVYGVTPALFVAAGVAAGAAGFFFLHSRFAHQGASRRSN
jgi:hypothetical protein